MAVRFNLRFREPASPFERVVREAFKVSRRLNDLTPLGGARLSASALVKETLEVIDSTTKRIGALRKAIEGGAPGLDRSRATVRRLTKFLRDGNWRSAPKNESALDRLLRLNGDPATDGELAAAGYRGGELFCVAVLLTEKRYPEAFGTVDDSKEAELEIGELRARQEALFRQIETGWTAADLNVGERAQSGHITVPTFKLSDGAVTVAPADSAGQRLIDYLIATRASGS